MTSPSGKRGVDGLADDYRADVIAGQVRGIVVEAIYEAKRDERTPGQIADDVAFKVRELVAGADRAAMSRIEQAMQLLDGMADDARSAMDAEVDMRAGYVEGKAVFIRQVLGGR